MITVEGLRKTYGDTVAVDDVSFSVEDGEIFGIVGPNGAGKTTSVECVQGLRSPDGGTVRVLGYDPVTQANELRQVIGAQLQDSALPGRLRVRELLELFASFAHRAVDIDPLMERWGVDGFAATAFDALSGGQRQRLFIALAFVNDPQVVFLDELTQGLDPHARRNTWDLIRSIRDDGTTVVLVTHFMDEAEHLCDRVAVIDHGTVVASNTPQGLVDELGLPSIVRFTAGAGVDDVTWLDDLDQVDVVRRNGHNVEVEGTGAVLVHVAAELVAHGLEPVDLRVERPSLEDAFLAITGRAIH